MVDRIEPARGARTLAGRSDKKYSLRRRVVIVLYQTPLRQRDCGV
jgi:hypothetical protein